MLDSTQVHAGGDGFGTTTALPQRPMSLNELKRPVEDELGGFRTYFREATRSPVGLLDKVTQYILRRKGKRMRPLLVLLAAKTCGGVTESSYRAAALVELLHTATLVHDDVVDDADRRRGVFSINALWKNKVAVLFGDFLLSRGLLLALDYREYGLLHTMSDAVRRMSEGELLQIEKSRHLDIDEETYFRIISDKTASLISACTTSGAISATSDEEAVDRMRTIGEKLGLAFQIRDDLFDFGVEDVGKPLGIDLKEKKMTLPLIYALRESDKTERQRILKIVRQKRKSRSDVRDVAAFVEQAGGTRYARDRMNTLAGEARDLLLWFPDSPARASMLGLVDYTVTRTR
ncbi:MAG TPA: polyprenyl synthetase family protein [Rhodothermales bacterium]|nr:polyprenyl synthetase family protein [Rhodothermales bacterium]